MNIIDKTCDRYFIVKIDYNNLDNLMKAKKVCQGKLDWSRDRAYFHVRVFHDALKDLFSVHKTGVFLPIPDKCYLAVVLRSEPYLIDMFTQRKFRDFINHERIEQAEVDDMRYGCFFVKTKDKTSINNLIYYDGRNYFQVEASFSCRAVKCDGEGGLPGLMLYNRVSLGEPIAVLPNSYILQSSSGEIWTCKDVEKLKESYIALDGSEINDLGCFELRGLK